MEEKNDIIVDDVRSAQAAIDEMNAKAAGLRNSDPKKGLELSGEALKLSEETGYLKGKADSLNNIGFASLHTADHEKAFTVLIDSVAIYEQLDDTAGIASAEYSLGVLHLRMGIFDQAIKFLHSSLALREKLNDKSGMAACYFQLTYIAQHFNDLDSAYTNALKAVELRRELNDDAGLGAAMMVLGEVYLKRKDYPTARKILKESLDLRAASGEKIGYFATLYRWTDLHIDLGEFDKAREFAQQGLEIAKGENITFGIMRFLQTQGRLELAQGNVRAAKEAYLAALNYAESYKFKSVQYEVFESLTEIYRQEGDYKSAYEHCVKFHTLKEEVISMQTNTQLKSVQFMSQLEFARKEAELEKEKNIELQKAYSVIEDKNREIIDSINYARRIQYTLLAHSKFLDQNLREYFVLFKPKDIVSGDFYWAGRKNNRFYLAVCDSTGHGVPGAFMSLLNISFLNEAVNERNISRPDEILDHVRCRLIENISQEEQKDGMDAILLCIDNDSGEVTYAAANNRPVLVSGGAITELDKDSMPVGKGEKTEAFRLFSINVTRGQYLYLYTDGFADQFGGPKGKKFKCRQLNELLASGCNLPAGEQKAMLENSFSSWKGEMEQVDDVCVIGIKL